MALNNWWDDAKRGDAQLNSREKSEAIAHVFYMNESRFIYPLVPTLPRGNLSLTAIGARGKKTQEYEYERRPDLLCVPTQGRGQEKVLECGHERVLDSTMAMSFSISIYNN